METSNTIVTMYFQLINDKKGASSSLLLTDFVTSLLLIATNSSKFEKRKALKTLFFRF